MGLRTGIFWRPLRHDFASNEMGSTDQQGNGFAPDAFACLFDKARAGDADALGQMLETLRRYLALIAEVELDGELRPKVAASDLVQQTFLRAQQAFDGFQGSSEAEWRGWLRRILVNELQQANRCFRGTEKRNVEREVPLTGDDSDASQRDLAYDDETPSQQAGAKEDLLRLERAMVELPADYRRIIELRSGRATFEQIGHSMGRSAEAARKFWARAVEKLGELIHSGGGEGSGEE
jgi:RNA polymerase sigma-70 factor (ECF subfamily)